ncbi:MAG: hypothetical protein QW069_09070 [Candidatus Caldarchaeum sp.]
MTEKKIHDRSQAERTVLSLNDIESWRPQPDIPAAERKQIVEQFVEDEKNQAKLSKPASLLFAQRLRRARERLEKGE